MGKSITFIMILAAGFVFLAGCPPKKPRPIEPAQIEPNQLTAVIQKPNAVEPETVETKQAEPTESEPNAPATVPAEPNKVEPKIIEPNTVEPKMVEPKAIEPITVELVKAEPNEPEPNEFKPVQTEPNRIEPNHVEPQLSAWQAAFYEKYAEILKSYVDSKGMVNYKVLKRKRLELKELLDRFAKLDPNEYNRWPGEEKIAFWLNAYNIQMLKIILDNYPIEGSRLLNPLYGPNSIRHIKGIWTDYKFIVMDEEFTLAAVEQRFFRKEFGEPKVFFAIFHASLSSPPLRNEPYYGSKIKQQLEGQTKKFLSSPMAFGIDRQNKRVNLSAIFQASWHGGQFVGKFGTDKKFKDQTPETRAVLNFITNYISRQEVDFLEVENYSVKFLKYNWTLNDGL
jgi:hypothetical protein